MPIFEPGEKRTKKTTKKHQLPHPFDLQDPDRTLQSRCRVIEPVRHQTVHATKADINNFKTNCLQVIRIQKNMKLSLKFQDIEAYTLY